MSDSVAKHERILRWLRWFGIAAVLTAGSLFIVEEKISPTLYLVMFILCQISMFAMITLGIYHARFKKKHMIHRHGD